MSARWTTHFFCIKCKERLGYYEVMCSYGRCPACGYKDHINFTCTIVQTFERAVKWIPIKHKWWQFWLADQGHWEYQDEG